MKRIFIQLSAALFLGVFNISNAQNISSKKWKDLFSFNNILVMKESGSTIVAATENGIFYYNTSTGEISKLTKANGLHEVKVTAFDYNPQTKTGLVGYQNGALDIITPDGVQLAVDIPIAASYNGNRRINHISITGNQAVISVGYGVSIFNLDKKEFGLSSFFLQNGAYINVNEAAIYNNKVYAATSNGMRMHDINTTFPVYSTWQTVVAGNFTQVSVHNILAFSTPSVLYYDNGGSFQSISHFTAIKDVQVTPQNIVVTENEKIQVYNQSGVQQSEPDFGSKYNTATIAGGKPYAGTIENGILDIAKKSYKPDGPFNNYSYKIALHGDQIWVSTGYRESYNTPATVKNLGYYHYDGSSWIYPKYFILNPIQFNILDVEPNPQDPSEVYFTNYSYAQNAKGIYKMKNDAFVKSYKNNDSDPVYNRPVGIVFDEKNNLFVSVTILQNSSSTTGYYFYNKQADDFTLVPLHNAGGVQKPFIKDDIMYMPSPYLGTGGMMIKKLTNALTSAGQMNVLQVKNNLPANGVVSAAIDKDDNLWIGSRTGLRILPNAPAELNNPNVQTEPVVIKQNGINEELFRDNAILQIAVDSGNHKWVSIDGGGVYYLSADGETTIQHFTKENSPLPNNTVTDIKVDDKTGKVYFVTLDGIVVYQSDVVDVSDDFGQVLVYPNPVVYSQFKGKVTLRGLAQKTNIRITDAAGNLVHQAVARGGFYEWDLTTERGRRVASGVYFVLMTNEDGTDKATAKIAVVN